MQAWFPKDSKALRSSTNSSSIIRTRVDMLCSGPRHERDVGPIIRSFCIVSHQDIVDFMVRVKTLLRSSRACCRRLEFSTAMQHALMWSCSIHVFFDINRSSVHSQQIVKPLKKGSVRLVGLSLFLGVGFISAILAPCSHCNLWLIHYGRLFSAS